MALLFSSTNVGEHAARTASQALPSRNNSVMILVVGGNTLD